MCPAIKFALQPLKVYWSNIREQEKVICSRENSKLMGITEGDGFKNLLQTRQRRKKFSLRVVRL